MPWKREFESCNVYDKWKDGDVKWTIEDLDPEDDNHVADLFLKYFVHDETFCKRLEVTKDPVTMEGMKEFWLKTMDERVSLACYHHQGGQRQIAAVNICAAKAIDDPPEDFSISGTNKQALSTVINTVDYIEKKADVFNALGVNVFLTGAGLLVVPNFRGAKLGARVLKAREPMCKLLGLKGTSTLFTGIASQKLAMNAGFTTVVDISFCELAEAGLVFPGDPTQRIKLMIKKYC